VRLPLELIERAKLGDELELIARDGEILIANRRHPRQGWAEAYRAARAAGELVFTDEDRDWLEADLVAADSEP
jgi:hypothetical protein